MVTVKCLYCDVDNDPKATGGYCDACGKRLPSAAFRPHRHGVGQTADGTEVELPAQRYRASEALFCVAALQLFLGGLYLVLVPVLTSRAPNEFVPLVVLFTAPPVCLFGLLGWLARSLPVPAAVLALAGQAIWLGASFAFSAPMAVRWLPVSLGILALLAWPLAVSDKPAARRFG
jgi:hypothetical protein